MIRPQHQRIPDSRCVACIPAWILMAVAHWTWRSSYVSCVWDGSWVLWIRSISEFISIPSWEIWEKPWKTIGKLVSERYRRLKIQQLFHRRSHFHKRNSRDDKQMRGIRKYYKNNAVWYCQSIQNRYKWMPPLFAEPFLPATGRCNSVLVQSFSHLGGVSNNNFLGCTNSQIVLNRGRNEKWIKKTDQVVDFSHLSLSWNWGASIERSCLRVFGRRGNGCDGTSTDDSHAAVLVRRVPAILHQ